jgi:iron(II)-dependent oxidoreductase
MLATQNDVSVHGQRLERLLDARRRTDELFAIVKPEAIYERPIPERHRIIFYTGHLEAFDWNLLGERVFGRKSFHPEFDRLFAFGIDPVGGGLPDDQPADWPRREQVADYTGTIRDLLDRSLCGEDAPDSIANEFPLDLLLNVAIEHRLMHAETLAYMLHQLPIGQKVRSDGSVLRKPSASSFAPRMLPVPAGRTTLGLPRNRNAFGWDNEFAAHTSEVSGFMVDQYQVTNGEYLNFMECGGYDTRAFWSESDWDWKSTRRVSHPVFWKRQGDAWLYRGMFEEIDLPLDAPVYLSHAEASAYACWAGKALPTEAEWQRVAYGDASGVERSYPWGEDAPGEQHGNFDFASWDPTPVDAFPDGGSAFGARDLMGNGWEWTSTPFGPLPGFEPFPFYRGYSADFFDGKHFVMKGGSARTAACMLRRSFRNWFQPHYQYVYAGFRCVRR